MGNSSTTSTYSHLACRSSESTAKQQKVTKCRKLRGTNHSAHDTIGVTPAHQLCIVSYHPKMEIREVQFAYFQSYMLKNWGTTVWLLAEGTFLHCQSIQTGFESQQTCSIGTRSTRPRCKFRPDHSPPSSAKSKNGCRYTTTLPYSLTVCTQTLYFTVTTLIEITCLMCWVNIFVQHLLPKETEKRTYPLAILVIWLRFHIWFQLLLLVAHVHPFVFHYVLEKKKSSNFKNLDLFFI